MTNYPGEDRPDHEQRPGDPEHTAPITPAYGQSPAQGQPDPSSYGRQEPPSYGQQQPYVAGPYVPPPNPYGYAPAAPAHPRATTSMVLGIIGLASIALCAGIGLVLSPFAWALGQSALREIRASDGRLGGESTARAGQVTGIIGTVLLVVGIVLVAILVAIIVAGVNSGGGFDSTNV